MKVYCKNCKHNKSQNVLTEITFEYKGNTFIFGEPGCGEERVGVSIDDVKIEKVVYKNENNICLIYERKWWKFWIKD